MSKKDKKVVNDAVSGISPEINDSTTVAVEEATPEITLDSAKPVKKEWRPAYLSEDAFVGLECQMEPSITSFPKLTINGKEIELTPATEADLRAAKISDVRRYHRSEDEYTGCYRHQDYKLLMDAMSIGLFHTHYYRAEVGNRLYLLTKGSVVNIGEVWGSHATVLVFVASNVKTDSINGTGIIQFINTSCNTKYLYISGTFKAQHSSFQVDNIGMYGECKLSFVNVHAGDRLVVTQSRISQTRFSGWKEVSIKDSNFNRYSENQVNIAAVQGRGGNKQDLTIEGINLGKTEFPNSVFIRDTDVKITHRTHVGSMPGLDPVQFVKDGKCGIVLDGDLVLTLDDLEAMRYRIPNPEAPVNGMGYYQPVMAPWNPSPVIKDGEEDKYAKLVSIFANRRYSEKVEKDAEQLLGLQFRPFYDAIVSRVKLFKLLDTLG